MSSKKYQIQNEKKKYLVCISFILIFIFSTLFSYASSQSDFEALYVVKILKTDRAILQLDIGRMKRLTVRENYIVAIVSEAQLSNLKSGDIEVEVIKSYSRQEREFLFVTASSSSPTLENEYVSITVNSDGAFTMQRSSDEKWLLYPSAGTTAFSMKIDESVYWTRGYLQITKPLTIADESTAYIEYTTSENVLIRHTYSLAGEAVKFEVQAWNNDSSTHHAQVRYLFDTQVDENDGSPLYAQGVVDSQGSTVCTYETDIPIITFSEWKGYDIWPDPGVTSNGTISTIPSRMVFAWWPNAIDFSWDYTPDPNQRFYMPGYISSPYSDSCVLIYLDLGTLAPGTTATTTTYYGIGEPSGEPEFEKLRAAVNTLGQQFDLWTQNKCSKAAEIFSKGIDKVKNSLGEEAARRAIGAICAVVKLARGNILDSEIEDLMGLYGITQSAARAVKALNYVSKAFNIIEAGEFLSFMTFNKEIFAESSEQWLSDNSGNILSFWTSSQIEDEFRNFLWEEVTWSESGSYASGLGGFAYEIKKELSEWVDSLSEQYLSNYPLVLATKKIKSLTSGLQNAEISPVMLVWLDEEGNEMELGNLEAWEYNLDLVINDLENAEFWSWAFTGLGIGLTVAKIALAPVTGGITAAALVAEVCIMATDLAIGVASEFYDYYVTSEAEEKLGIQTVQTIIAAKKEIINGGQSIAFLRGYLDYGNLYGLISDAGIDNSLVRIKNFYIDDLELPSGQKTFTIDEYEVHLKVENWGSSDVPLKPYVIFYAKKPDGTIEGPVEILFTKNPQNISGEGDIDFEELQLGSQESLGAEYFIGEAYVAAGPALVSKVIGPATVHFELAEQPGLLDSFWYWITGGEPQEIHEGELHSYDYTGSEDSVFSDFTLMYQGSDLDLHVYDASGNHVGLNYATGEIENQIQGAYYSGSESKPESIRVPHSTGYQYQVKVVAVSTDSSESYQVVAMDTPDRPAVMELTPEEGTASVDKRSSEKASLVFSVKELGGQRNIETLSATITDLTGTSGTISSSQIEVMVQDSTVPAASSLPVIVSISSLSEVTSGVYTGTLNVAGNSGSQTEARKLAKTPPSAKTLQTTTISESASIVFVIAPPEVTSTTPANNATDVALNTAITATFSLPMDSSSITTDTFIVNNGSTNISGTVTYSDTTATFSPSISLDYETTYTATIISDTKDLAGNTLDTIYDWTFTTQSKPSLGDLEGNEEGQKCFIATAAYGSALHPHIDILRDFRDKYLMSNKFGRTLVSLYYKCSPYIAEFISKNKALKVIVRNQLVPFVALSYLAVRFGTLVTTIMFVLIFAISIFSISFRRRKLI